MKEFNLNFKRDVTTKICIGDSIKFNLFDDLYINERVYGYIIITDENVYNLYKNTTFKTFKRNLRVLDIIKIKSDEKMKNLDTVKSIYDILLKRKIDRNVGILAVGGGVIGDIAGFIASTMLRGLNLIHIPTTLLSQVDSSIGGKNGVNLGDVKNLIGSFYHPRAVLIDTTFLKTLGENEIKNGIAEVLKYGIGFDDKLFNILLTQKEDIITLKPTVIDKIIEKSVKIKIDIVRRDEMEREGIRKLLNLGHTFGHAIESIGGLKSTKHGEAVSLGILIAAKISMNKGVLSKEAVEKIKEALVMYNLPIDIEKVNFKYLKKYIVQDKKVIKDEIDFIFINKIGQCSIQPVRVKELWQKKLFLN